MGFVAGAARIGAVLAIVLTAACRTGHNYVDPAGPRYAGGDAADPVVDGGVTTLRVVTFNIEHAREIESATALLRDDPDLRHADMILLQEMDAPGVRRIALELALEYVYYPAIYHFREGNDFGNAILSRWPIVDDEKIVLPYVALATGIQRIAAAATLCVAGSAVRVYSIHLGTLAEILPGERRSQLRAVLADAADHARVIVGGDLNDVDVGRVASAGGFDWPTRRGRRTATLGRWDHIFSRGLVPATGESTGTVLDNRGSSDHRPVWTVLSLDRDGDTAAERCDAGAITGRPFKPLAMRR
jgi:endonuclease/exonuclease/phosphatase family metal-dependent hydrolase